MHSQMDAALDEKVDTGSQPMDERETAHENLLRNRAESLTR